MNIETSNLNQTKEIKIGTSANASKQEPSVKFADELNKDKNVEQVQKDDLDFKKESEIVDKTEAVDKTEQTGNVEIVDKTETIGKVEKDEILSITDIQNKVACINKNNFMTNNTDKINENNSIDLPDQVDSNNENSENLNLLNDNNNLLKKDLNSAFQNMNTLVNEFNQLEDKSFENIKKDDVLADNKDMINNDFNIQDKKDIQPQVNINMGFNSDGQPFSSFMNNENEKQGKASNQILGTTLEDIAEEKAILSTMEENIAIANKNQMLKDSKVVINEEGIKRVDTTSGIKLETIVKYDTVVLTEADAELFVNLVEKGEVDLNQLTSKTAERFTQVSKSLANLIATAMEKNQPVRIEFDNNISVIIKISREGKISADFLPSSQVAEAYLKENLPLLRQRFNDNNIEYDSLNQRERKDQSKEHNKKKERNNE